ncbi:MAG TPA: hypothetical protein VK069_04515, partial [Mycolicibacillus parakoreensis]|nr:hypothetical protein [Mycolicibacillus parakoreensis]
MAVVEAIYLAAAVLWILVVVAAVGVGGRYLLKLRARRRRVQRWIAGVRQPMVRAASPYRAAAMRGAALVQRVVVDIRA